MGFRDVVASQSLDERVQRVEKKSSGGLPSGFSWVISVNAAGIRTLQIVDDETGRVVMEGF